MNRLLSVVVACALTVSAPASAQNYNLTGTVSTSKTIVGEDIVYPTTGKAVVTSAIVVMAPGERTILHRHGVPLFAYGNFLTVLLNFIILAFIIFLMVRQINRLKRSDPPTDALPTAEYILLLREIRDELRRGQ